MNAAIDLRGLGKRYWKLEEQAMLLKSVLPFMRPKRSEMWALRDVDLTVERGETIGVLGRNGAGKSTMLRLLAGVSQPSEGLLRVAGRIAPLISVGVGFHPEMSGRENVYVNGMLLGLSADEIADRFDEIVAFAELADFIDTPVKFYSSGMFMRLGFAVAVHAEPDVLLVDEVLAVGDLAFQLKCFDRMRGLQERGTSIVIVSHAMTAIRLLCPRVVFFRKGRLEYDGNPEEAISRYYQEQSRPDDGESDQGLVSVLGRELRGRNGGTHHVEYDEQLTYRCRLQVRQPLASPQVAFSVRTEGGLDAYTCFTPVGQEWRDLRAGDEIDVEVPFRCRLAGGTYRVGLTVLDADAKHILLADTNSYLFYVTPRLGAMGVAELDATIAVDGLVREHPEVALTGGGAAAASEGRAP